MTRRLSSGPRLTLAVLALLAAWTAFVLLGVAHGFWRPLLAPRDDLQAFAKTAREIIDCDLRGNTAFALIEDGRVAAEHFASEGGPVTHDTLFQLASLSKWIAAWGVMALVEEGRIDLDAPVEIT